MKSISNSDPIYSGIACQEPVPRFLLISLKYLRLSTFLKAPDLIRPRSLIAAHFLWQVCQTAGASRGRSEAHGTPSPFLHGGRWGEVTPPTRAPCLVGVSRARSIPEAEEKVLSACLPSHRQGLWGFSALDLYTVTPQQLEPICMVCELSPQIFAASPFLPGFSADRFLASGFCEGQLAGGL